MMGSSLSLGGPNMLQPASTAATRATVRNRAARLVRPPIESTVTNCPVLITNTAWLRRRKKFDQNCGAARRPWASAHGPQIVIDCQTFRLIVESLEFERQIFCANYFIIG